MVKVYLYAVQYRLVDFPNMFYIKSFTLQLSGSRKGDGLHMLRGYFTLLLST